jgi:hypothetical protein
LTHATKKVVPAMMALALGLVLSAQGAERTSEITSNDIWRCAGNGDTLWMVTSKGLNFTEHSRADTLQWRGFTGITAWALAFGGGTALVCKAPSADGHVNDLWMYRHQTGDVTEVAPGFPDKKYAVAGGDSAQAYFLAGDAVWANGYFWIAYGDGGLVRISNDANQIEAFYPGSSQPLQAVDFSKKTDFDSTRSVVAVAADDSAGIWVGCRASL